MKAPDVAVSEQASHAATQPRYRPDVDGLRAVAVLAVLGFHGFPETLTGGFVGVDVFFVISGYLITSIILGQIERGTFTFSGFYVRRIRRIFPALILVLLTCLALGWFVLLAGEYRTLAKHVIGAVAFVSNFLLWSESGYFDAAAEAKPLLHLWSLGIEEQFYFFWPLICVLAFRSRRALFWVLLAVLGASFVLNVAMVSSHATATFYNPLTRFWELMLGAILAWAALGSTRVVPPRARDGISIVGFVSVMLAIVFLTERQPFPGWWALPAAVGTFLLIAAGPDALINRALLSRRALVWVGLISYPLYLWHWPLLSLAHIMESGVPSAGVRWGLIALSFVLAWLTYAVIEKPIRFGGHVMPKAVALLVSMGLVGCTALYVHKRAGFPLRYVEQEQQLAAVTGHLESTDACQNALHLPSLRYCLMTDPARPPTVALVGDSHANRLFFGLSEQYAAAGENLVQLGGGGCVPFWGFETGRVGLPNGCDKQMPPQLDYVLHSPDIRTVILANRGTYHIEGTDPANPDHRYFIRRVAGPANQSAADAYAAGLRDSIERFTRAGKRVIVIADQPELDRDPLVCLGRAIRRPVPLSSAPSQECPKLTRASVDQRDRSYLRILRSVVAEFPGVSLVDLRDAFCDGQYCYTMRDGKLLYMDPDHLSEDGSRYVASRLRQEFLPQ